MKKSMIMLLSLLFLLIFSTKAIAAAPRVMVDGLIISFEPTPFIEKGNTLVPLAPIFEVLGTDVIAAPYSDEIIVVMGDSQLEMQVGSDNAYINGVLHKLPVPIKRVDGCLMVPIRIVNEALFARVKWVPQSNTILVSSKEVIYLAQEITKGMTDQSDKARAVHDWICQKVGYESYNNGGFGEGCDQTSIIKNTSPAVVIHRGKTDSFGFAKLNLALLHSAGITVQAIGGIYKPNQPTTWNKSGDKERWAWNKALVDNKWIIIDTALDATTQGTSDKYYNPHLSDFEKDHEEGRIFYYIFSNE